LREPSRSPSVWQVESSASPEDRRHHGTRAPAAENRLPPRVSTDTTRRADVPAGDSLAEARHAAVVPVRSTAAAAKIDAGMRKALAG